MMTNEDLLRIVAGILLLALSVMLIPPASGEVDYYPGYSAEGIHSVPPTPAELAAGVIHKYDSGEVMVYISGYGIRYVVKTDSGNRFVQYEFRNPNTVIPSVNASEKSVTWFNLYENVDIKYTLETYGLKQEIIIRDTPPATKFYEKITVSDGVTYQKEENREIWFYYGGERLFRITTPFAVDTFGTYHDLTITRTNIDGSAHICIDATEMFQVVANTTYPLDEPAGWFERLVDYIFGDDTYNPPYPVIIDPATESGGIMFFWDIPDIPTLHATVADDTKISYSAEFDLYLMSVPFYHNNSSSSFAFNETVYLKSNNDANEAYFRWAGNVTFNNTTVTSWDTVAGAPAPKTDSKRAHVYSDSGAKGNITNSYFTNLGYGGMGAPYTTGVTLQQYSNGTVCNNTFYSNSMGVYFLSSNNNTVHQNIANNNTLCGIFLHSSSYNDVRDNIANDNNDISETGVGDGISVVHSSYNNTISQNLVSGNNGSGIELLWGCSGNLVIENYVQYSDHWGISLQINGAIYPNIITRNYVYDNREGILSFGQSGSIQNIIYHNTMVNNTAQNAWDGIMMSVEPSTWDDGAEGNFYSDYSGTDANSDGVGDTPYPIYGDCGSVDRYPLMVPYPFVTLCVCAAEWVNLSMWAADEWAPIYNLSIPDPDTNYKWTVGVVNNSDFKLNFSYGDGDYLEYNFTCTGERIDLRACAQVEPLAIPIYLGFDNTIVLFRDLPGNFIDHAQVSIYDQTDDTYLQKWTDNSEGFFSFARVFDVDHDVQIAVRTFGGVYTISTVYPMNGTAENFTWANLTVPLDYNIYIEPVDQSDQPLHGVFAGISEYAISDPQAWWGSDTGWGYIPITNCWGFTRCDITAEKAGYQDYEATALNWTSKTAMVKDYRHGIVMET